MSELFETLEKPILSEIGFFIFEASFRRHSPAFVNIPQARLDSKHLSAESALLDHR